jgi:hypothetical protein
MMLKREITYALMNHTSIRFFCLVQLGIKHTDDYGKKRVHVTDERWEIALSLIPVISLMYSFIEILALKLLWQPFCACDVSILFLITSKLMQCFRTFQTITWLRLMTWFLWEVLMSIDGHLDAPVRKKIMDFLIIEVLRVWCYDLSVL